MSKILRSYLRYARGETKYSLWAVLSPLQFATRAWMSFRIIMFNHGLFSNKELCLPVISVGNNSLGGTNKTPMTELLVRQFREAGIEAGLVSRGYRTKDHEPIWIGQNEKSLCRDIAGDEPLMLYKHLPDTKIVVSRDRVKGVELLKSLGVRVAVTDDTFQYRRMGRDVDIVLVDSTAPFGNGRVVPSGAMRESKAAFGRADMVVITKANQVLPETITEIKEELSKWVKPDKMFLAYINLDSWIYKAEGKTEILKKENIPGGRYVAFSAIGNSSGFYSFLRDAGVDVAASRSYRDHHIFSQDDISYLRGIATKTGADGLICTEKDIANLPEDINFGLPLYVPRIVISLGDDELRFRRYIHNKLKPQLMVASNGYGEDAIGVVLAKKLKKRFACARVSAFAFVGLGRQYENEGVEVISPPSDMSSGGVIKYSMWDLINDFRQGLGGAMKKQIEVLQQYRGVYRTPICVGDVYLMASVLWGQGLKPALVATAKTVRLAGHFWIERELLKRKCRFVWTRDAETAVELERSGVETAFAGNPVMDLIEKRADDCVSPWDGCKGRKIILLAGSRRRAYEDARLVLETARLLSESVECTFVNVMAATIDAEKMAAKLDGWELSGDGTTLVHEQLSVKVFRGAVSEAAWGADLLIGLGGTANQLCAGQGVPVVSILEKGKLRQKKLLREAEVLVKPEPAELAQAAMKILGDDELWREMSSAGMKYLGGTGALDSVVDYCADVLGWENKCRVYEEYGKYLDLLEKEK